MTGFGMPTEKLTIKGHVASKDFLEWIVHRARRLGLHGGIVTVGDHRIEILIQGPIELIDAMEVGCSLGPTSVQVEHIDRTPGDFVIEDRPFAYISDES